MKYVYEVELVQTYESYATVKVSSDEALTKDEIESRAWDDAEFDGIDDAGDGFVDSVTVLKRVEDLKYQPELIELSECCGEPIIEDYDLCSACKDHI